MAEFVGSLPPATAGGASPPKGQYEEFADELKLKPLVWAKWPRSFDGDKNRAASTVNNLRRGNYVSFRPPGHWQFAMRSAEVYIRYVGANHDGL